MSNILSGTILILLGLYTLFNFGGFFTIWISLLLIWLGFESIEKGNMTAARRARMRSKSSPLGGGFQNIPQFHLGLARRLQQEFAFQTPINILAGVIASVSIHIAKSDGRISREEIEAIRFAIATRLGEEVDHEYVKKIVDITKDYLNDIGQIELFQSMIDVINLYLNLIEDLQGQNRENFTFLIFGVIYEVAIAEGGIDDYEEILFQRICNHFSIPREYQAHIKRSAYYNYNVRKNNSYQEQKKSQQKQNNERFQQSIEFFNLPANYSEQELEKAWKKIIMMYHPDKFHNEKPEIYHLMNQKFLEAKEIYEYLKGYLGKERPHQ